jgi:hypothetical protein
MRLRDVRWDGQRFDSFTAKDGCGLVELRLVPPANGYARSHFSQTARNRETDSPARSRDQGDLAC